MFDIKKIITYFKTNFNRRDLFLILFILFLFFLTRLYQLDQFPIFSDEGIYIRWAKVAWKDASWRFISLTDGRQPLQTWGTIPFLKAFPENALLAGRLFGVFAGLVSLAGLFVLSFYLFGKRTAYIACLLYIITPFFLFFDRLAMVDTLVNAASLWALFFSILLVKTLRLDLALIFGLSAGMFSLAKSSTAMFLFTSLFAPILTWKKKIKENLSRLLNYFILLAIVLVLAFTLYNVQRLSPFLHFVVEKNKTFVKTFDEFLAAPFSVVWYNLRFIPYFVAQGLGWATFFFGLAGFYLIFKKDKKLGLYFLIWLLIPYLAMTFFMKVLFSRYVIFIMGIFVLLAAFFFAVILGRNKATTPESDAGQARTADSGRVLDKPGQARMTKRRAIFLLVVLTYLFTFYFDYTILFDYKSIPFTEVDRGQYLEAWTAGWGAREIVDFARRKLKEKPVVMLAEGSFGMAGDVLDVFVKPGENITIKGYWPLNKEKIVENQKLLGEHYVYAVFAHRKEFPPDWPLGLIEKYDKPGGKSAIYFFRVTPSQ